MGCTEAKQPIFKSDIVQLFNNGEKVVALIPSNGCLDLIVEDKSFAGFGKRGRIIPGVKYDMVTVSSDSLLAHLKGKKEKPSSSLHKTRGIYGSCAQVQKSSTRSLTKEMDGTQKD